MRSSIICTHRQILLGSSRRMRWARHVSFMGEMRNAYKILVGKPKGIDHLRDLDVDWRMILKWIVKK